MLAVLSPAKSLSFAPWSQSLPTSTPRFGKESGKLLKILQDMSVCELQSLMNLSQTLAKRNAARYMIFDELAEKPAILAFNGDVYQGLEASSLTEQDLMTANTRLRILSGFYGLLCPFDSIKAYRLEMGRNLKVDSATNLYQFWDRKITVALNADAQALGAQYLVNLASQEYFAAIKPELLVPKLIQVHFKEEREGKLKIIAFNAKRARGMMARYLCTLKANDIEALKAFDWEGYNFSAEFSNETNFTFTRCIKS